MMSKPVFPLLLGALGLGACATGPRPDAARVAPQDTAEIVWPLPPEAPRIRYVGSFSSEADVGKRLSLLSRISRGLMGAESGGLALVRPFDVYASDSSRVYVTDASLRQLLVFDFDKKEVQVLGTAGAGRLSKPMGLGGDGRDRVLVTDPSGKRVVAFGPTGQFLQAFGGPGVLLNPVDVAMDSASGRVYVADSHLHQVVVFDDATGAVVGRIGKQVGDAASKEAEMVTPGWDGARDVLGNRGGRGGEFLFPVSVAVAPDGTLYVSDGINARVQAFDRAGRFLRQFGGLGDTPGSFARPKGIAVDTEGHVYVVDVAFNNLQVFDGEGRLLISFGRFGSGRGELRLPLGVHIDGNNRVYVADRYNKRVQVFQYLGDPAALTAKAKEPL